MFNWISPKRSFSVFVCSNTFAEFDLQIEMTFRGQNVKSLKLVYVSNQFIGFLGFQISITSVGQNIKLTKMGHRFFGVLNRIETHKKKLRFDT